MSAFKFSPKVKELRILLCQTSKSSEGVRKFIQDRYVSLKKANPTLPIMIRECSNIEPRLYVRTEYGREQCLSLAGAEAKDIAETLKQASTA